MLKGEASLKREPGFDYIRVLSTLMIICFHFHCYSAASTPTFDRYANGNLSTTFVALFFMLSGACLYANHGGRTLKLRTFYFRRWKSVLVPFYLVFLALFLIKAVARGRLFPADGPAPWTLFLSAAGMDGFLLYRIPSYYSIGEWFLGAIVLLYLAYPVLQRAMDRLWWALQLAVTILFALLLHMVDTGAYLSFFTIEWTRNLVVCLFSFVTGMSLSRNAAFLKGWGVWISSVVLTGILLFVPIEGMHAAANWITAACLFVALMGMGSRLGEGGIYPYVRRLSALTYGMFLVHHVLIRGLAQVWNPSEPMASFAAMWALILISAILSKALSFAVRVIENTRVFRRLEKICTG